MGRPLNKRNFGNSGDVIQCQFHNGTASVAGFIVRQKGTAKFLCEDGSGNQSICFLVDKASDSLSPGEMSISVRNDAGEVSQINKITQYRVTTPVESKAQTWVYTQNDSDELVEIAKWNEDTFDQGVATFTMTANTNPNVPEVVGWVSQEYVDLPGEGPDTAYGSVDGDVSVGGGTVLTIITFESGPLTIAGDVFILNVETDPTNIVIDGTSYLLVANGTIASGTISRYIFDGAATGAFVDNQEYEISFT